MSSNAGAAAHVLVVGIDGLGALNREGLVTPALDSLDWTSPVHVDECAPTISGPGWSTILTGLLATSHGVYDNDFTTRRADTPDVFSVLVRRRPEVDRLVVAGWPPLVTEESGGPLLAGGHLPAVATATHALDDEDEAATVEAVRWITECGEAAPAAAFVYLGNVDEVGHEHGSGAEYAEAVVRADARLGRLLTATADHAAQWTVLVVSDHGHVLGSGGHGGDSPAERTALMGARGPQVSVLPDRALHQADIAVTVLSAFDEPVPASWVGQSLLV